ncbi:unnamed protein product [Cylindrotheca closterium]|uniref:Helicase-associated domain-containing protein n=1 Tax=Cylindrotheca closterium TaxID=2856 RepID=A0AAD2FQK2_9STRA|nr:unnamed protein product [Cylindrotheca closterium]
MNAPTNFQRSSSWTLQSYLKSKDTPQDDEKDNDMAVPKTDLLRGFSSILDTSAAYDVLPHQVENQHDSSKTSKRVSIISSASEADTRCSESDDDDSWMDALCDVPVEMIDAIDPLPIFQDDVLATPTNSQTHKRSADDLISPTIVTPYTSGKHIALRRVSVDGFLPAAATPPAPRAPKNAPPTRPSRLDNVASPEANVDAVWSKGNFRPSQLFQKELRLVKRKATTSEPSSMKAPPATKDVPFPNISSSGRVRKSVKLFDPLDYENPRKPRKSKSVIKKQGNTSEQVLAKASFSSNDVPYHIVMEPIKKKRKMETPVKVETGAKKSDTSRKLKSLKKATPSTPNKINCSTKVGISKSADSQSKENKTRRIKASKARRAAVLRPKDALRPRVLTPTKVKGDPTPLDLSKIPVVVGNKTFSDIQAASWTKKYKEFLAFKEFYGHTAVPHFYTPNLKLSRWVKRQRYQYKLRLNKLASTMTDDRITLLNEAGFIWDSHTNVWMERYRELSNFVKKHGHSGVTSTRKSKKHCCLAAWVKHQRRQYKLMKMGCPSHMSPDRIDLLNKIGFQWFIRPSYQNEIIHKLQTEEDQTTRVPRPTTTEAFQVDDVKPDQVKSTFADL